MTINYQQALQYFDNFKNAQEIKEFEEQLYQVQNYIEFTKLAQKVILSGAGVALFRTFNMDISAFIAMQDNTLNTNELIIITNPINKYMQLKHQSGITKAIYGLFKHDYQDFIALRTKDIYNVGDVIVQEISTTTKLKTKITKILHIVSYQIPEDANTIQYKKAIYKILHAIVCQPCDVLLFNFFSTSIYLNSFVNWTRKETKHYLIFTQIFTLLLLFAYRMPSKIYIIDIDPQTIELVKMLLYNN